MPKFRVREIPDCNDHRIKNGYFLEIVQDDGSCEVIASCQASRAFDNAMITNSQSVDGRWSDGVGSLPINADSFTLLRQFFFPAQESVYA